MSHVGDRYDPEADLSTICSRIAADLGVDMPGTTIRMIRRVRVGSRTIDVSVIGHAGDLTQPGAVEELAAALTDHAMRYGWDRSSYAVDLIDRHFGVTVEIDAEYWGGRQNSDPDARGSDLTPTAFMKAVRPGDSFEEIIGTGTGRLYRVVSASSGRFVTDDGLGGRARIGWHRPAAACLKVRGDRVRIAIGSAADPEAHHDLKWNRMRLSPSRP